MATKDNNKLKRRLNELQSAKNKILQQRVTLSIDLFKEIDDVLSSKGTPSYDSKANSLSKRFNDLNDLYDTIEKKLDEAITKTKDDLDE